MSVKCIYVSLARYMLRPLEKWIPELWPLGVDSIAGAYGNFRNGRGTRNPALFEYLDNDDDNDVGDNINIPINDPTQAMVLIGGFNSICQFLNSPACGRLRFTIPGSESGGSLGIITGRKKYRFSTKTALAICWDDWDHMVHKVTPITEFDWIGDPTGRTLTCRHLANMLRMK